MGSMPHKPPANYGYHIRMLQGLAATIDKDSRLTADQKKAIRTKVNGLTIELASVGQPPDNT